MSNLRPLIYSAKFPADYPQVRHQAGGSNHWAVAACALLWLLGGALLPAQVETVEGSKTPPNWVSHGRVEGHLALRYSPAGAFSPDSSLLAVVNGDKIVVMDLAGAGVRKVLKPRLGDIVDLDFHSANFLASNQLFLLGQGTIRVKGKAERPTPLLALHWDIDEDRLSGKVDAVGASGGFGPILYFPQIGYLGMNKGTAFDLWNTRTGSGGRFEVPALTQQPNLFEFSPDGHWLLLAQIASGSATDPIVVFMKEHKFADSLRGHQGTVMSMAFSRDSKKVVTACEDGKVRIYSVGDWKLLQTLVGHQGPVHWAEFSPDGQWVVSAGEDKTVRVWSAEDGKLLQTLEESQAPVLTAAFSPNGQYLAASTENTVLVWQRTPGQ